MISRSEHSMTATRFVEYIQNCFNDRFHSDMQKTMVAYLEQYDELFIACLARVVLRRHPRQYRVAPGIAELEKHREEAMHEYGEIKQNLKALMIEDKEELTNFEKQDINAIFQKMKEKFSYRIQTLDINKSKH